MTRLPVVLLLSVVMAAACGSDDDLDRSNPEEWEVVSEGVADGSAPDLGVSQARIEQLQPVTTSTSMDQTAAFDVVGDPAVSTAFDVAPIGSTTTFGGGQRTPARPSSVASRATTDRDRTLRPAATAGDTRTTSRTVTTTRTQTEPAPTTTAPQRQPSPPATDTTTTDVREPRPVREPAEPRDQPAPTTTDPAESSDPAPPPAEEDPPPAEEDPSDGSRGETAIDEQGGQRVEAR